jgi:phenylalanyl-tRNA synthetase beta chain
VKVPLSWLREFVEITEPPDVIAEKLTAAGMKVEKVHRLGEGVEGIIVAEVTEVRPHPNADKLSVVRVRTGCMDASVVCGASNYKVGDKVPMAQPGSRLPGVAEIEARKFRGVFSEGMLCSARELGIGDDHSGIVILGPDAVVGTDASEVLGLGDVVLELEINPNRPDAMGLLGIAREVAACTGAKLKDVSHLFGFPTGSAKTEELVEVEIVDPEGCSRYMARVIEGVSPAASPMWAQRRLAMAGIRPISAVVDATNYAMLVTAHPLHAFDLDKVAGPKILVRRAAPGEELVSIDGVTRALEGDDLVIADESKPIALAGVMGGIDSEVTDSTTRVILESASFEPRSIFRTSRRLGLRSEASARFERGVDADGVAQASELAAALIAEWAGGRVAAGVVDVFPKPIEREVVGLRPEQARALLGADLSEEQIIDALIRLGLNPVRDNGSVLATVPSYRVDLRLEEDLIEEVARVIGYDQIPARLPSGERAGKLSDEEKLIRKIKRVLTGAGLFEARTSSLIGPADLARIDVPLDAATKISNPISQDESVLRTSLIPGLINSAGLNFSRRAGDVRLFEIGKTFHPEGAGQPREALRLAMFLGGSVPQQWHTGSRELDFFDLKGALELVLRTLRVKGVTFEERHEVPFHPTRAAGVFSADGVRLGLFGEMDPQAADRAGLPARVSLGEFDLEALLTLAGPTPAPEQGGKYPAVLLDVAFVLPDHVQSAAVLSTAEEAGGELLESVRLIDVYRGEQVGEGRKSMAFALTFRSPERTLNEGEAIAARDAIAAAVADRHGGMIRA